MNEIKKNNYIDNNSYNNNTQYCHHSGTVSFLQRVRVHLIRLSEQTEVHKRVSCSQEDFPVQVYYICLKKMYAGGFCWFSFCMILCLFIDTGSNILSNSVPKRYHTGEMSKEISETLTVRLCTSFQKWFHFLHSQKICTKIQTMK